nr:MAG TPA: protein of unknown function (DUF829) [Caudoviricetes sp.]DAW77586.1 MAG TPA: protein of unknown function (DUF829) [Caudoviricetes sp.]
MYQRNKSLGSFPVLSQEMQIIFALLAEKKLTSHGVACFGFSAGCYFNYNN